MRKRSRFVIALVLTLAAVIMPYGAFREGFLLNVVDFAVLMISGSSLLMFGAAGGIIWKAITEKSEQVPADMKSLPLPEVATSTSKTVELLECGIEPDKQIFHLGESLWFRIRFRGTLRHGYRAAQATFSNGDILPIYDDKTLRGFYGNGTLNRRGEFDEKWQWAIPRERNHIGHCRILIAVITEIKPIGLLMRLKRWWLLWQSPHRIDLAKPKREAVDGKYLKIELIE